MDVQYSHNYSTFLDIYKHLKAVSSFFLPPLEGRVNIEEYANKLFIHAEREEAYYNGELTGLIAYYYTEGEKEAFISNVSVLPEFKNKGIASSLLSKVKLFLRDKGVCKISMEVANNSSIIDFYRKNGFDLDREIDHTKFMMVSYLHDQIPLVSILCLVYNHKDFLRKCLDGFVMQQTNFPIEILIHDDASTDGSAEIIREYEEKYPLLFKPIYQTINQYSKGIPVSCTYQYPRCSGKYLATCEGDDYWVDPLKLQKQVEFLEANPEYGMCYSNVDFLYQATKHFQRGALNNKGNIKPSNFEEHLVNMCYIAPCSWVIRKQQLPILNKNFVDGSFAIALEIFAASKIYYLDNVTAVYRINSGSVTQTKNSKKIFIQKKGVWNTQRYYRRKYSYLCSSKSCYVINYRVFRISFLAASVGEQDFIKLAIRYAYKTRNVVQLIFMKILQVKIIQKILRCYYMYHGQQF